MKNKLKSDAGRSRAPNPFSAPSDNPRLIEKNRKSQMPSLFENLFKDRKQKTDSNSIRGSNTNFKSPKILDQQYSNREKKECETKENKLNKNACPVRELGTDFKIPNEKTYYSAYSYGKKSSSVCDISFEDIKPSPRGLTRDQEAIQKSFRRPPESARKSYAVSTEKPALSQFQRSNDLPPKRINNEIQPDMMQIETRRTIVREGGIHLEETSIIQFPKNLPSNVQVITAQFVPGFHKQ